jgi:hypothetical protein
VADALLVGKELASWGWMIKELWSISDDALEDFRKAIVKYGEEQGKKARDVDSMGSQVMHL